MVSLAPHHYESLVHASAIQPEIVASRGYETAATKTRTKDLGFSESQRLAPGLVIPLWDVQGQVRGYQLRPDSPRVNKGKVVKYETPFGMQMALDVHPSVRPELANPAVPLWVTEGVKKGDCLVSQGCCAVALLGVWNWRGTNDLGGKTALADWEMVALNGRMVIVVFDSDVMLKASVHAALARLGAFLARRGASVKYVYLPSGADQAKTGVDDFIAAGHSLDDVVALASPVLRRPESDDGDFGPYRNTPTGIIWLKETRDALVEVPLTNFGATIVADVAEDDGVEVRRLFEIEVALRNRISRLVLPAERFAGLTWPTDILGAQAIVYPGMGTRDRVRAAIQLCSTGIEERTRYTHTGWRLIDGQFLYLHSAGAIGPDGPVEGIEVEMPNGLNDYSLSLAPTVDAEIAAIRASLDVLKVAPHSISVPLLGATFAALLSGVDFSVHLAGSTGVGKSELAALSQQHFGPEMSARNLPSSWSSTGNAIEALCFYAKDAVIVVDDFVPQGSEADVRRANRDADRVLRAQGNHSGRQRMRADGTLHAARAPRGLVLSTGEDIPLGQSLRARIFAIDVNKGDVDWALLSSSQNSAASGQFANTTAGFIRWLAPQYEHLQKQAAAELSPIRERATSAGHHQRTPGIVAVMTRAWRIFLLYAVEASAISVAEADVYWSLVWTALIEAADAQGDGQGTQDPARRFLKLLSAALASGYAHLLDVDGGMPAFAGRRGWRHSEQDDKWQPQGRCIGWVEDQSFYLEPDIAFAVAKRLAEEQAESLTVTRRTLEKRLTEAGLLIATEQDRYTVRKVVQGKQRRVLGIPAALLESAEESGLSGLSGLESSAEDPKCDECADWQPELEQFEEQSGRDESVLQSSFSEFRADSPDSPVLRHGYH